MAIRAVQTDENRTKHASYTKAAVIGGVGGYALKYLLPITPQEKDDRFGLYLDDLKTHVKEAKLKEIEAIRNLPSKTLAEDTFIGLFDKKEVSASRINGLKEPLASGVVDIITRINDKGRVAKESSREIFKAVTKHIRPTSTFVSTGASITLAAAFMYNTLQRLANG